MSWKQTLRRRWRPWLAYGMMGAIVGAMLLNLLFDHLVTRYEHTAPRDPGSPYLKGSTPRDLGSAEAGKAVLFVHGFIGAQSNFNDVPDRVAAAGWFVRTMRLPGHGTSPREFERTTPDELVTGVLEELRTLKARFPRVVIVGHSMGGALVTLAASEEPVDGLILCAPYFDLAHDRILGIATSRIIQSLAPVMRWAPARPGGGPINKKENRKLVDYYHWIPSQGGLTALEIGRRARSPELCGSISAPLLLIHSRADTVTSQKASEALVSAFGSEKKETLWLTASDHVIFWDYEAEEVANAILAFLQEVEQSW